MNKVYNNHQISAMHLNNDGNAIYVLHSLILFNKHIKTRASEVK